MIDTIQHWAFIIATFLAWFYIGGCVFLFGPAISVSELKCARSNTKDEKEKKRLQWNINAYYVYMSIYPVGFLLLGLYHGGVLA